MEMLLLQKTITLPDRLGRPPGGLCSVYDMMNVIYIHIEQHMNKNV